MKKELKLFGDVLINESLKNYTTYKIGGVAKYMLFPDSLENLVNALKYLKQNNIEFILFGNCSNVIVSDREYNEVVIKLDKLNKYKIDKDNLILNVEAGAYLPKLSNKLANLGYSSLEWASGLPGSVGGSIYGNAGAYNTCIFDKLIDVTVFKDEKIITLNKNEISFGYRTTEFKKEKNAIILSARIKLEKKSTKEILDTMIKRSKKRLESQPLEYPSAGSVFRNPSYSDYKEILKGKDVFVSNNGSIPAGYLIEKCNLKGMRIGGAKISEKHANFIINDNNASSDDVINLIDFVKKTVEENYGIKLIEEQELIN